MSAGRNTIGATASVAGVGLHTGVTSRLTFRPASVGAGIAFERTDRPTPVRIAASATNAVLTERQTQLGDGPDALHTVEHVLAAVVGAEVDDLLIEIDGPEPPILDGSAAPFLQALRDAGIREHGGEVEYLRLAGPVRVREGDSVYEARPGDDLELDVRIDFTHPLIGAQRGRYAITPRTFADELAAARTFGFVREVDALRSVGLIRGGSTENAIVLDDRGVVGAVLRWPDEFVRHKALDCVGDLALAGRRVRARITATRPSHRGTVRLVREMLRHATKETNVYGIEDILRVLPHRYPFLLVDRILEMEQGKRIVGLKNVTINEPFFQGHFPGHPIMPGVLVIEAMAQVGGVLLMGTVPDPDTKVVYFTSLNNVKWRRPVKPGDQLRFELEVLQIRGPMCKMRGVARVDGDVVAEAEMGAMVRDR